MIRFSVPFALSSTTPNAQRSLGDLPGNRERYADGKPARRLRASDFGPDPLSRLEMLTARQVFEGENASHVFAAVLTKEPDWTTLPALFVSDQKNIE